jgi:hypothetical protein
LSLDADAGVVLLAKPTAAAAAEKQWAAVALPASGKSLAVLDPATGVFSELSLDPSLAAAAAVTSLAGGALLHISSSSSSSSIDSAVVALAASGSSLELSTLVKCSGSSSRDCAVGGAAGVAVPAIPDDFTAADAAVGASASSRVFAIRAARGTADSSSVTVAVHEVVAGRRSSGGAAGKMQYETELPVEQRGALRAVFPLVRTLLDMTIYSYMQVVSVLSCICCTQSGAQRELHCYSSVCRHACTAAPHCACQHELFLMRSR